jgi:biofilm protein TabA
MTTMSHVGAQTKRSDWSASKAQKWFKSQSWTKGFKATPYTDMDVQELAYQYNSNPVLWEKAFSYLANTNLDTLLLGKHILDGDNLYVTVSQGPVKSFEDTKWEAHKKYIDIQYVISGKEKMGKASIDKTTVLVPFDETKDIGFYSASDSDAVYYEANPGVFLIFFPKNAHRPGIKIEGNDKDKKLVVKIKAVD